MLTTPTSGWDEDHALLSRWGLKGMQSFVSKTVKAKETPSLMRGTEERRAQQSLGLEGASVAEVKEI